MTGVQTCALPICGKLSFNCMENDNDEMLILVNDTGKGILQENLGKIFDPFFTTEHEGSGLGLAISERIISEHKGKIEVESELGKGTTFKVILPQSQTIG